MGQILTKSGGLVETIHSPSRVNGDHLYLHIDQSANMNTGEGEASIMLTNIEVKDLISYLNNYITYTEGKPYVVIADLLIHPDVKIMVGDVEIGKVPELINPYIAVEDVITPGEEGMDYDNYFDYVKSDLPKNIKKKRNTKK